MEYSRLPLGGKNTSDCEMQSGGHFCSVLFSFYSQDVDVGLGLCGCRTRLIFWS